MPLYIPNSGSGGGGGGASNKIESTDIEAQVVGSDTDFDSSLLIQNPNDGADFMQVLFPAGFALYGNVNPDASGDWNKGLDFQTDNFNITTPASGKALLNGLPLGGMWQLVSDQTLESATTNFTVGGLDLDADGGIYRVTFSALNTTDNGGYRLQFNGQTNALYYLGMAWTSDTTDLVVNNDDGNFRNKLFFPFSFNANSQLDAQFIMRHTTSGTVCSSVYVNYDRPTMAYPMLSQWGMKYDDASNITSLTINSASNGVPIGARITIEKLVQL